MHLGPPLYNYKALQLWLLRCELALHPPPLPPGELSPHL
jgi:hypothetical protein